MKTLWLLRHAKSSWSDPSLPDHERPLKRRGIKAAKAIGRVLAEQTPFPDVVYCSTAVRAVETWRIVAETIAPLRALPPFQYRDDLYHASPESLRSFIAALSVDDHAALLVGHNPGLEEFIHDLTATDTALPTGALVKIEWDADTWPALIDTVRGRLAAIWRPRELE